MPSWMLTFVLLADDKPNDPSPSLARKMQHPRFPKRIRHFDSLLDHKMVFCSCTQRIAVSLLFIKDTLNHLHIGHFHSFTPNDVDTFSCKSVAHSNFKVSIYTVFRNNIFPQFQHLSLESIFIY